MTQDHRITVKILDRNYPIRINWEDEEIHREAAKRFNHFIGLFKQTYPDMKDTDLLAMTGLQFSKKVIELEDIQKTTDFNDDLEKLCEDIDTFIKLNT